MNFSSKGLLFRTTEAFPLGQIVEASIDWPVSLDHRTGLKLVVEGPVVWKAGESAAIRIEKYQFITSGIAEQVPDCQGRYSSEEAKEFREIMVAVADTAAAVGDRDQRYSSQFGGLTARLQAIASLEDLSSIRRSVAESALELKSVVEKMAEEGEKSISQLRAEVANYRARLEQSEKREALDPLTGLANRREIEAQVKQRISWRHAFCLAILDLNGFKRINDIHGHVAGDDLLKQFAAELKAQFPSTDVVGRWGGDEFLVVVDSDLEATRISLERVRKRAFGDYKISGGKDIVEVNLNASIGLAVWDGKENAVELLARADERMYEEKNTLRMPVKVAAHGRG